MYNGHSNTWVVDKKYEEAFMSIITISEAAEIAGISQKTIRKIGRAHV